MSKAKHFTIDDIKNSHAAKRNPHLFGAPVKIDTRAKIETTQPSNSKYNNKKVVFDDIEFDSKKEGNRYLELKGRQLAGEITDLRFQRPYEIGVNGEHICTYIADFQYKENGQLILEDVKSSHTRKLPVYRIKNKMMKAIYNIEIKEV